MTERPASRPWLGRRFILIAASVLLALQVAGAGFLLAGAYGLVPRYGPATVSFEGFYAAGVLADRGEPAWVYDESILRHFALQRGAPGQDVSAGAASGYVYFIYSPLYLLLCAPLAWLPFAMAFAAFEIVTLIAYVLAMRRIVGLAGPALLLPVLAFPASFWTLGYGQNSFLTAALFGAATLLVDRRPWAAGFLFGLIAFKPQFGLLIPVALLAGKRWPAIAGAVLSVCLLAGLSVALFGWETWSAYVHRVLGAAGTYQFEESQTNPFASISPFAAARLLGFSVMHARLLQLAATLSGAFVVGWVWRNRLSLATRSAVLIAATLVASPYGLLYDVVIGGIAGAWLAREGVRRGFLPWEKAGLTTLYILPLFIFQAGLFLRLPLVPLLGAGLVAICLRRAWHEYAGAPIPVVRVAG
ncbi:MAG TPA: glycosyltransferase family 87 protein [Acetobacteraceae bacterium]|nr:glycosyltransferase family 87 protein [Acetobacteraceae bacterium]